jgi:hypothetical protein
LANRDWQRIWGVSPLAPRRVRRSGVA